MTYHLRTGTARLMAGAALAIVLSGTSVSAQSIRFWTTEEQPERLAKQQDLAAQFEESTGTAVEVIPVSENDLGTRATAAFAAGDLPDVIYHTLQYALPWAEAGILDTDAASDVVEDLGALTFAQGAQAMAAVPAVASISGTLLRNGFATAGAAMSVAVTSATPTAMLFFMSFPLQHSRRAGDGRLS